jgi:hypothetical protein
MSADLCGSGFTTLQKGFYIGEGNPLGTDLKVNSLNMCQVKLLNLSGVHPVWRQEALRRVHPVHGVGQALRLPALPVRPQRQLWRLEGNPPPVSLCALQIFS